MPKSFTSIPSAHVENATKKSLHVNLNVENICTFGCEWEDGPSENGIFNINSTVHSLRNESARGSSVKIDIDIILHIKWLENNVKKQATFNL